MSRAAGESGTRAPYIPRRNFENKSQEAVFGSSGNFGEAAGFVGRSSVTGTTRPCCGRAGIEGWKHASMSGVQ
jgi:hypothetical protein